jgi:hypothetical protein
MRQMEVSRFRNFVASSYLDIWTMDKTHKPIVSGCYVYNSFTLVHLVHIEISVITSDSTSVVYKTDISYLGNTVHVGSLILNRET